MLHHLDRRSYDIFSPHSTFIEGHRGMNRVMPENTILSFKKSIEADLDSIELDIWLTKDLIPVVIHGGKFGEIDEFTNGKGNVKNLSLKELSVYKTIKGDQPIPLFEEVLILCKDKIFINIELKDDRIQLTFAKVIALIEKYNMFDQVAFSSFKHKYYDEVTKYSEEKNKPLEFGFLYEAQDKKDEFIPYKFNVHGKISMNLPQKDVTKEIVTKAHSLGYAVHCWFCMKDKENDEVYKRLIECGVDAICCNEPEKAKIFRNSYFNISK